MTALMASAERIIEIIRRDLKLGDDVEIAPLTALFGGSLDLDSLDALLLIQSVQKEFDVRVPTDAIGPDIFATVETLTQFINELSGAGPTAAGSAASKAASRVSVDQLPHRPPFRFISGDLELTGDGSGRAIWRVTGDEAFFAGHFPNDPVVPGVLIGEALAQLCGLILIGQASPRSATAASKPHVDQRSERQTKAPVSGKLAQIDLRFEHTVIPPAQIILEGRLLQSVGALSQFEVRARIGNATAAQGSLTLSTGAAAESR